MWNTNLMAKCHGFSHLFRDRRKPSLRTGPDRMSTNVRIYVLNEWWNVMEDSAQIGSIPNGYMVHYALTVVQAGEKRRKIKTNRIEWKCYGDERHHLSLIFYELRRPTEVVIRGGRTFMIFGYISSFFGPFSGLCYHAERYVWPACLPFVLPNTLNGYID